MIVKCKVCGREWDYKGTSNYAQCYKCKGQTKVFDVKTGEWLVEVKDNG